MNLPWKPWLVGDINVGTEQVPVIATWFGGDSDPQDDGQTSSGLVTKGHPTMVGCALPLPTVAATKGSPIPIVPYLKTFVRINCLQADGTVKTVTVPLIDCGPALYTGHAIDLTVQTFKDLGGDLEKGVLHVWFSIIDGAKYIFP